MNVVRFSLRTLLIAVTLAGMALAVMRLGWPWSVALVPAGIVGVVWCGRAKRRWVDFGTLGGAFGGALLALSKIFGGPFDLAASLMAVIAGTAAGAAAGSVTAMADCLRTQREDQPDTQ